MPHRRNQELAALFERIADLMEIDEGDRFRITSYRRAARTLGDLTEDVEVVAAENRLTKLPGIGKGTAERIASYLSTGHIDALDKLEAKLPPGLAYLLDVPGMGPKKTALVYRQLGVADVNDLKAAIDEGRLAELPGFGEQSVKKIADGLGFLERSGQRTPLGAAMPIARELLDLVAKLPTVRRASLAGSLRRGAETIGDADVLCDSDDGPGVVARFVELPGVTRVLAKGPTKGSVLVGLPRGGELQVDLRVVPGESYGAALQYFTGSKQHNVRLREMAVKRKLRLNEYGLFDGKKLIAGATEEEVYAALGLPWIPPELREDRGELDRTSGDWDLVTLDDIRGDLHMHTVASDGRSTIEEMAKAAKALGYKYIAICDHSKSSTIANGLSVARMKEHADDIRRANDDVAGIEVLVGCECDVLGDGALDFPDDVLAICDVVVASVHQPTGKLSPTERTIRAMKNPYVTIIGHPTGRLINRRQPMDIDIAKIVAVAVETGTVLEVNASWQRLDLNDVHVALALAAGATLCIDTDAHHTEQLKAMEFGVLTARRGGASAKDVLNTLSLRAFKSRAAKKRG